MRARKEIKSPIWRNETVEMLRIGAAKSIVCYWRGMILSRSMVAAAESENLFLYEPLGTVTNKSGSIKGYE